MEVLIVEDDPFLGPLLKDEIEARDNRVELVTNFTEAIQVEQNRFDAIICDVELPDGDGIEALAMLRARQPKHCIFVAISGYSQACTELQCHKFGIDGFLAKPFQINELLAMIESGKRQARII